MNISVCSQAIGGVIKVNQPFDHPPQHAEEDQQPEIGSASQSIAERDRDAARNHGCDVHTPANRT